MSLFVCMCVRSEAVCGCMRQIFRTGKTINFIRICCNDHEWVLNPSATHAQCTRVGLSPRDLKDDSVLAVCLTSLIDVLSL